MPGTQYVSCCRLISTNGDLSPSPRLPASLFDPTEAHADGSMALVGMGSAHELHLAQICSEPHMNCQSHRA